MYFFYVQLYYLSLKATNTAEEYKLFLNEKSGITEENSNKEIHDGKLLKLRVDKENKLSFTYCKEDLSSNCNNQIKYLNKSINILNCLLKNKTMTKKKLLEKVRKMNRNIRLRVYTIKKKYKDMSYLIYAARKERLSIQVVKPTNNKILESEHNHYDMQIKENKALENINEYLQITEQSRDEIKETCKLYEDGAQASEDYIKEIIVILYELKQNLIAFKAVIDECIEIPDENINDLHDSTKTNVANIESENPTKMLQPQISMSHNNGNNISNLSFNNAMIENMRETYFDILNSAVTDFESYIIDNNSFDFAIKLGDLIIHTTNQRKKGMKNENIEIITITDNKQIEEKYVFFLVKIECVYKALFVQKLNEANKKEYIEQVIMSYNIMIAELKMIYETKITPIINVLLNDSSMPIADKAHLIINVRRVFEKVIQISRKHISTDIAGIRIVDKIK